MLAMFSDNPLGNGHYLAAFILLFCTFYVISIFRKGYHVRRRMMAARDSGLTLLPGWSPFWGNLKVLGEVVATLPQDVHGHVLPDVMRKKFPDLPPVFGMDLWPASEAMVVCTSPEACFQFTQERSAPKHPTLGKHLRPLMGPNNLITVEGQEWKFWRGIFNPGFSLGHLTTLVPGIVQDTLTFCNVLEQHAKEGSLFQMEEATMRLTVDIIGRVVFDHSLNAQSSQNSHNELVNAFRVIVNLLPNGNEYAPWQRYKPLRPVKYWYYTRIMNREITHEIESRFALRQSLSASVKRSRNKSIIDLALDGYFASKDQTPSSATLDPVFLTAALSHIKAFIFAGHDTTASTLCYVYQFLALHSHCLSTLIAEHDAVFGSDTSQTPTLIAANPSLLSKLPYTLAVIKETLRLWPPASTVRTGSNGDTLSYDGASIPMEGFIVWSVAYAVHRNPAIWVDPESFRPERWLVEEGDPLHPVKNAFRPFELGPRNCIGQELAILESKVILACTVRRFEVKQQYEEWDRLHPRSGVKTLFGERMYPVLRGAAKPSDGMPCRVRVRA